MIQLLQKNKFIYLFIIIPLLFIILANFSLAQTESGGTVSTGRGGFENPIGVNSFTELLKKIIGYLIMIGAPIVVIMVIYGAFLILTAGDSPEKVKNGTNTIKWAAIGYVIIICAYGIIYIIGEVLGVKSGKFN